MNRPLRRPPPRKAVAAALRYMEANRRAMKEEEARAQREKGKRRG